MKPTGRLLITSIPDHDTRTAAEILNGWTGGSWIEANGTEAAQIRALINRLIHSGQRGWEPGPDQPIMNP